MGELINLDHYRQKKALLAEALGKVSNIVCDTNGEPLPEPPEPEAA